VGLEKGGLAQNKMIKTRNGLLRLVDWQSIFILEQYRAIRPRAKWKVLDIGSGIGDYSIWVRNHGADSLMASCHQARTHHARTNMDRNTGADLRDSLRDPGHEEPRRCRGAARHEDGEW